MRTHRHATTAARALTVLAVGACACFVAGCGRGDSDEPEATTTRTPARTVDGWALPNADRDNSRDADSEIQASNADELGIAWRQELTPVDATSATNTTPLVVDEVVYVQDAASNVWSYDLETGDELWRRMLREPAVGANGVAYENGQVFATTPTDVLALDSDNGSVQWRTRLVEGPVGTRRDSLGVAAAPMAADGRVLVGDSGSRGGGTLAAFDAKTGEIDWWAANPVAGARESLRVGGMLGTPLEAGDLAFAATTGAPGAGSVVALPGALRAFDADSGELQWAYVPQPLQRIAQPGPEPIDGTAPATDDLPAADPGIDLTLAPVHVELEDEDAIVVGGSDGVVRVVGADDGVQLWASWVGSGEGAISQVAVTDDTVYAAASAPADAKPGPESKAVVAAFDTETGEQRWQLAIDDPGVGALTVTNDAVLVADSGGTIHVIEDDSGAPVTTVDTEVSQPGGIAVAGDHLLVAGSMPASGTAAGSTRPVVVALALGADEELEPDLSADTPDEPDEVSDTPATNPVPRPDATRPPPGGSGAGSGNGSGNGATPPTAPAPDPNPTPDPEPSPDPDAPPAEHEVVAVAVVPGKQAFDPDELEVDAGLVRFRFTNATDELHDFTILDADGEKVAGTGPIASGYTYLEVELEPGMYRFVSTTGDEDSMTGTLTVS